MCVATWDRTYKYCDRNQGQLTVRIGLDKCLAAPGELLSPPVNPCSAAVRSIGHDRVFEPLAVPLRVGAARPATSPRGGNRRTIYAPGKEATCHRSHRWAG
jgi:hypothetical protein